MAGNAEDTPSSSAKTEADSGTPHAQRATTDRAQEPEWHKALTVAEAIPAFARPSSKELSTLATACTEPRQLQLLLEAFARHAAALTTSQQNRHGPAVSHAQPDTNNGALPAGTPASQSSTSGTNNIAPLSAISPSQLPYAYLCDFVDDSSHDLREWINALTVFEDWLSAQGQPPQPLTMLLPYLSCSAEAQAASPMPLPLPHIVADMLELYGYEGSL